MIGARATARALLLALLEPRDRLKSFEESGDYFSRLAFLEELKTMPFGTVWDYHCLNSGVPVGYRYLDEIRSYEKKVTGKRGSS